MMIARVLRHSFCTGAIFSQQQQRRAYGFVPFSQDAIASERDAEATDVDSTGVGVKPPVKSTVVIPLGERPELRVKYENIYGGVRLGVLLEDIDAFAGRIAYKHCDGFNDKRPLTVVTANVDRITYQAQFARDQSILLEGTVSYVGSSSMEIRVEASQIHDRKRVGLDCVLTMVARDRYTNRAAKVHRLQPINDDQKQLFDQGYASSLIRKAQSESRLAEKPPTQEEVVLLHELFKLKSHAVIQGNWMDLKATRFESTFLMHPEYKNLHNKIFGGFLMRNAYDIAYSTAHMFFKDRPYLVQIDDIHFIHPVNLGSMLTFESMVAYKEGHIIVVRVEAKVLDPRSGSTNTTNVFFLSFRTDTFKSTPDLMPDTYADMIVYLEGRRRLRSN